jgi:hypothetical protein
MSDMQATQKTFTKYLSSIQEAIKHLKKRQTEQQDLLVDSLEKQMTMEMILVDLTLKLGEVPSFRDVASMITKDIELSRKWESEDIIAGVRLGMELESVESVSSD